MFETTGTIANLSCSILKYFGLDTVNATLSAADAALVKEPRNVVVLLLDAMGMHNMEQLLCPDGFFYRHLVTEYSSVFPPTTVAATTSVDSGLFPAQHGWLGWTMYYPQLQKNVVVYTNRDDHGEVVADFPAAQHFMPYESILERIARAGFGAHRLMPFGENKVESIRQMGEKLQELCAQPGKKYVYAYWSQPDSAMHTHGVGHEKVRSILQDIEDAVEGFAPLLKDTLFFITADHGHIDSRGEVILDDPVFMDCLLRLPSIEPRTLNLFIKPGMQDVFKEHFAEHYGQDFLLFTRQEALDKKLFGPPPFARGLEGTLGDYIAVAKTNRTLFNNDNQLAQLKGVHAGGMEEERRIPLIAVENLAK